MGQVLIRNLDDALIEDYKRAAADRGRSLEAELRDTLERTRPRQKRLSGEALRALAHELWEMTPPEAAEVDSTPVIRADRDAR